MTGLEEGRRWVVVGGSEQLWRPPAAGIIAFSNSLSLLASLIRWLETSLLNNGSERAEIIRDRFRLTVVSVAGSEAKKYVMEISQPVMTCISDLAFKYSERLAKDLELFAQHGNRKTINMDDVILLAHRNEHVACMLKSISSEIKGKEVNSDKKFKRSSKKEEKAVATDGLGIS